MGARYRSTRETRSVKNILRVMYSGLCRVVAAQSSPSYRANFGTAPVRLDLEALLRRSGRCINSPWQSLPRKRQRIIEICPASAVVFANAKGSLNPPPQDSCLPSSLGLLAGGSAIVFDCGRRCTRTFDFSLSQFVPISSAIFSYLAHTP